MSTAKVIKFPTKQQEDEVVADLKDGYTKTANDIQNMKPKLKMSGREWQVFEAIICLTYGWNKKQDRVTNTVIAGLTGLADTHVSDSLKALTDRKIITCVKQGSMKLVGVNKVVSEWVLDKPKSGKILPESGKKFPKSGKILPESVDTQYKNNNIIKDPSSENPDGFANADSNEIVPVEQDLKPTPVKIRPDAAIQTPKGDKWGTAEDLKAAEYLFNKIQIIRPAAKTPNWPEWANTIRIMREADGRTHREICEVFLFANQDAFWSSNILSPAKLRDKWDTLCIKRETQPTQKHQTTSEMWAEASKDTSWAKDLGGW
jgi:phage replication O-like protein O